MRGEDRLADLYDHETGRSNFVAFVLGGVVIAGGLLGFLYYDSDNASRRDITTGSIGQMEAPSLIPSIQTREQRDGARP